ncbi:unnamed protein product, partial [Sphagnum compactum]
IINYLDSVVDANPTLASTYSAGQTFEKRELKVIALKSGSPSKAIWLDCGIHAREWISPSTCIYMIDKLNAQDPVTTKILNQYEIHFMPLVNPDGYDYTWTTSRLWRKNRVPNAGSTCIGVDLNRNYGFQWMVSSPKCLKQSSVLWVFLLEMFGLKRLAARATNPCSDTFAGPFADSEKETRAMEDEILKYKGTWDSYLTIHTYGLWWFLPWGYSTATIPDYKDLEAKGQHRRCCHQIRQ